MHLSKIYVSGFGIWAKRIVRIRNTVEKSAVPVYRQIRNICDVCSAQTSHNIDCVLGSLCYLYKTVFYLNCLTALALLWRESCGGGGQIVFLNITTIIYSKWRRCRRYMTSQVDDMEAQSSHEISMVFRFRFAAAAYAVLLLLRLELQCSTRKDDSSIFIHFYSIGNFQCSNKPCP
jgi:hypothetical protein